jgi:GTP-binding protein YchF
VRDVETIETELGLADLETVERRLDRARRAAKAGRKEDKEEAAFFEALLGHLSDGHPARTFPVPDAHARAFRECFLLTAKPVLYLANVDEASLAAGNPHTDALEAHAAARGAAVLRVCAKIEAELSELGPEERAAFLEDLGLEEPGLYRLIHAAYALLELVTYFTAGPKEVRAWTIRRGTKAPQAAGEIHSDFERTFIRAEVIPFEEFVACGGEAGAKAAGRMRVEGKDYVVQDGDVCHFRVGG